VGDRSGQLAQVAIEDAWSPRFTAFFGWYVERKLRGAFHAVRMLPESDAALQALRAHAGPVLVALNHASWWDPLIAVLLHRRHFADRDNLAPMDAHELRRFRILRKLGIFGIDPDDPGAMEAMAAYVQRRLAQMPHSSVILTPQGRFVDVRQSVVPRPGAAALLAARADMAAWSVAIEYAFWTDARPEVFLRVQQVERPVDARVSTWQRSLQQTMEMNRIALADAVQSREPARFRIMLGGGQAQVNPLYDLWLRVTGRGGAIDIARRVGERA